VEVRPKSNQEDYTVPSKGILQSVTFWGSVIAVLAALFPKYAAAFGITGDNATNIAQYIVMAIGFILTVWGRLRASNKATLFGVQFGKPLQ
jgi:hypothetical protein